MDLDWSREDELGRNGLPRMLAANCWLLLNPRL